MRILLDECVDRRLSRDIVGHDVQTVPQMGWAGKRNGELLGLAASQFDAFIFVDRKPPRQQELSQQPVAVMVLVAASNRLADLRPLVPQLLDCLKTIQPGQIREIA